MKKNVKFAGIKNILSRDEMKQIKGGCCSVTCNDGSHFSIANCCGGSQSNACTGHGGVVAGSSCSCG